MVVTNNYKKLLFKSNLPNTETMHAQNAAQCCERHKTYYRNETESKLKQKLKNIAAKSRENGKIIGGGFWHSVDAYEFTSYLISMFHYSPMHFYSAPLCKRCTSYYGNSVFPSVRHMPVLYQNSYCMCHLKCNLFAKLYFCHGCPWRLHF